MLNPLFKSASKSNRKDMDWNKRSSMAPNKEKIQSDAAHLAEAFAIADDPSLDVNAIHTFRNQG